MRFALAFLALASTALAQAAYRQLATFSASNAAFVEVFNLETTADSTPHPVLITTSFGAFSSGSVYFVDDPKNIWASNTGAATESVGGFKWPNSVVPVPESISPNSVLVADGFLVPFKDTGGLYIIQGTNGDFGSSKPIKISTDKSGWFYHNATFIDINGDGKIDVLSARANKGIFSSGGELVWLENPGSVTGAWTEHVITEGPEVMFQVHEMDGDDSTIDLIAAQFFSAKLRAYFFSKADPSQGYSVDIDTALGQAYSIQVVDLNADGKKDLLVTTHENGAKSAVYAYEIPENVNGTWTRHTLAGASNFPVTEGGFNQYAPGFAYSFFPKIDSPDNKKPSILVAGDGSQSAYLMTPGAADFEYSIEVITKVNGVIGSIGIADVDGDGYVEFFVPDYDQSQVIAYTFSPAPASVQVQ
eukprot:TRINITY_DN1290_c0_g1_i1.p1 TRINITY_DN1290_c0_g1~~TRINITY_DN1290_c0_g1_i1.p1  ORF type:complete len:417 (-),score=125.51 TRINITY_DN1290_c0_g1_i1:37-1287(-)